MAVAFFAFAGCAHVQTVVTTCEGATPELLAGVGTALAVTDYEGAVTRAAVGVAPCLLVATVQEIAESLARTTPAPNVKAALDSTAADPVVVQRHAREWLAVHGGAP